MKVLSSVLAIINMLQEALALSGASEEEIAQTMLEAMAASGASPETIAKSMQAALANAGLSKEEVQKRVIEAMGTLDAATMRKFLDYSERQLYEMCKECEVLVSGTKLCHALELTACGASPGAPTPPTGKIER